MTSGRFYAADPAATVPGARSLGVGAQQAAIGAHAHPTGRYFGCAGIADKISNFGKSIGTARSNGTDTARTYRVKHRVLNDCFGIRLVYTNFNCDDTQVDAITVRAGLEVSSTVWPVFFNGKRDVQIDVGGMAVSDPIPASVTQNTTVWSRTYVQVASAGLKWPLGAVATLTANGEGNTTSDMSLSGTVPTVQAFAYSPFAIVAEQNIGARRPFVSIIGDSIAAGQNLTHTEAEPSGDYGFAMRALQVANIGYINASRAGDKASDWGVMGRYMQLRSAVPIGTTHAIVEFGINDITNGASLGTMQTRLGAVWAALTRLGIKVYQTTITPVSTSTDSWATTGNQTTHATNSVRTSVNDWIRTTPSPLSGYFEVADTVESARNSGIWKALYTADGTHPSLTGHNAAAAAVTTAVFV